MLCLLLVAIQGSNETVVCRDWAALKDALQNGQRFAYEFDGKQLHIWRGAPNVEIVANAEREPGHNAATAFPDSNPCFASYRYGITVSYSNVARRCHEPPSRHFACPNASWARSQHLVV